jgi:hypothetical protein
MLLRFITLAVVILIDRHVYKSKGSIDGKMKARSIDRLSDSLEFRISITDRERLEEVAYRQKRPMAEVIRAYVIDGIQRDMEAKSDETAAGPELF